MTLIPTLRSEDFANFIKYAREAPYLAVDTETWGKEYDLRDGRGSANGLSIAYHFAGGIVSEYFGFRNPHGSRTVAEQAVIGGLLQSHPCLIFHNAKFDLVSLSTIGINYTGKFYDTMLMSHLIDENTMSKGLDHLAHLYLKDPGKKKEDIFVNSLKYFGWKNLPVDCVRAYAAYDAELTLRLWEFLQVEWARQFLECIWEERQQFVRLIIKMEAQGVRTDDNLVKSEFSRGQARMQEIQSLLGLNPGSRNDLETLLIDTLHLSVLKETPGGQPSFDKTVMPQYEVLLEKLNNPTAALVLEYRGYQTATGLNYKPMAELLSPDGRLRPNYKLHGTVTGRLSCEKPNLQQIPKVSDKPWNGKLKQAFIPAVGFNLYEGDYSQLELRLGACYAQERGMLDVFKDPDRDIFTEMALALNMTRFDTKTLTYSLQYGGGVNRISNVFGVSPAKAAEIKDNYFNTYPGFKRMTQTAGAKCRSAGEVKIWSGRRRHFQYPKDEAHKAFNSVIQGGAADIVMRTMLRLDREVADENCRMLLQVHDSVVFEIAEGMESEYVPKIKQCMENVTPDFGVWFRAEIKKWGES